MPYCNTSLRAFFIRKCRGLAILIVLALFTTVLMVAPSPAAESSQEGSSSFLSPVNDYFAQWFDRVDATLAEQPRWAPPVATTSPRLQEVLRYDLMWQSLKGGHELANYTYWANGIHNGQNQLFITPGLVVGKFPLWGRLACMFGVGFQVAVTDNPLYHRNFIFTSRIPF